MQDNIEHWMHLAKRASTEQDPVKLLELIAEINKLLLEKEQRLIQMRQPETSK